ncbi:MAG TPA: OmpA family protein [Chitinophagales bacterium]|nr:OmpA family protein [Chitinophagales bacterium]
MKNALVFFVSIALLSSCAVKKKYADLQALHDELTLKSEDCQKELAKKEAELAEQAGKIKGLQDELEHEKKTNTNLLDRLADLMVVSQMGAESIKKSLDAINEQSRYIQELNKNARIKDSLNLALVTNLKRSLADVKDEDVKIEVKKGVVYISLSDKMLFKSGSYKIQPQAEAVLGKIAQIINDHKELDILVEGHTDNVPIKTDCLDDNWDLSVMRSTAVVRLLQTKFNVAPERMTAGGRSEYVPKASNETASDRSLNRRTEIIILPKLDQFFQLITPAQDTLKTK